MKSFFTTLSFTLFIFSSSFASTIFVQAGQNGTGSSWEDATGNLQEALNMATIGTEIWVARGTYFPSDCKQCTAKDRAQSFNVREGIKLYGGFSGNETSINQRDPKANPTQLSGAIGFDDNFDNASTVVYFENVSANTILDGFTISGGMADGKQSGDGSPMRSGGGIYNICTTPNGTSSPTIKNCLFFENMAAEGGAIFNYSKAGNAFVLVESTSFLKNHAVNAGGAAMDNGAKKGASTFMGCKFVNNDAKFGGAFFSTNADTNKEIFDNCKFINNESEFGGAGFISSVSGKQQNIFSQNCSFKNNKASEGNEFYFQSGTLNAALKSNNKRTISL